MQRGEPVENLVSIEVYPRDEDNTVRIGSNLKEDTKLELVNLLRTYADVFAWTAADMPRIDPEGRVSDLVRRTQNLLELSAAAVEAIPWRRLVSEPLGYRSSSQRCFSQEGNGVQKPIYYVSKVLQDVETRYPKVDRIALALITSDRRLRPYFQSHSIIILTDQPLRKVLLSPEASGRLVNWSVELGEFDIQYKPRTAIKAQALADFIVEFVGSSGAEIILISPEGFTIEYALRFASNNEAEYEALLAGIKLAHALKVDSLLVHSDSQLVVNHVLGDYEARDEIMTQYLELVKISAVKFKNFTIHQIPRDQNTQVDALSRLISAEATDGRRSVYLEFLKDRSISSQIEIGVIDQEPVGWTRSSNFCPRANYQVKDMRRGTFVSKLPDTH
ncbi:LOW QUALITY PROTEIN: hypothetical protein RJ639_022468 [Escallonia herrerae]|uniref:RNase H type-1 domain-containing protein n=1 Tax=Escallonia herrerae TaxID=1293975 RepID=A0AA89AF98_9ASTE|nr:LOW QUALITY PROTEIN: hypothetical protein RJ639_022468 [Escallonia herrerae]